MNNSSNKTILIIFFVHSVYPTDILPFPSSQQMKILSMNNVQGHSAKWNWARAKGKNIVFLCFTWHILLC